MKVELEDVHGEITEALINASIYEAGDGDAWELAHFICGRLRRQTRLKFKGISLKQKSRCRLFIAT